MENASRAADMTLQDFLVFVTNTIVDDPAAPSYGLKRNGAHGSSSNFYTVASGADVSQPSTAVSTMDALTLQTAIAAVLKEECDGVFSVPQLNYFIECVPRTRDAIPPGSDVRVSSETSILRIHVYDVKTTSYDSQSSLLAARREDALISLTQPPASLESASTSSHSSTRSRTSHTSQSSQAEVDSFNYALAEQSGLITSVNEANTGQRLYRLTDGASALREFMMKTMPYMIIGAQGTAIQTAALSTIQNQQLASVNLIRSFNTDPLSPNGESPNGLPLQVIPCECSITSLGCPLLEFAGMYFLDFNTGTTIDNIYGISGLSHRIEPGGFITTIKMCPQDGWGEYRSLESHIGHATASITAMASQMGQTPGTVGGGTVSTGAAPVETVPSSPPSRTH